MDDTTAPADSGTEQTSIDFGETQGDTAGSANQGPAENQAESEGTHETDAPRRSMSELRQAFEAGEDISDDERDRILTAAKKGLKTDEQEAEFLKANPKRPAKEDPKPGQKVEKPAEKAKDKDALSDPLARLVKEINPTKPEPEEALKSIQSLKADYRKKGERLSSLDTYAKQVGFDNVESVLDRAMTMEKRLEQLLKTPDGIRELLKAYDVPETVLGQATQPAPSAKAPELEDLDDEEFPQGGKIKSAMARMAQNIEARIRSEFETKYGSVEKNFGEIQTRIAREEEYRRVDDARDRAVRDVESITKLAIDNEIADWILKDPAEKIFAESTYVTYKDGKKIYQPKREPHPEWPVFERLLEIRKEQYHATGTSDVEAWVGKSLLKSGVFQKGKQEAAAKARAQLLTKQRQNLQPTLVNKGRAQAVETFRMPESEEDIDTMTPEQQRELRRRLMSGELKVKGT